MKPMDTPARLTRLARSITRHLGGSSPIRVTRYGEGVDCWIDLVEQENAPPAVARSAKKEVVRTSYDGIVDFGAELEKQIRAAGLLRLGGVPTPAVLAWHRTSNLAVEPSWMLLELVDHFSAGWSEPDLHRQLGAITRRIHSIESDDPALALFRQSGSWGRWITERILMRATAAARYIAIPQTGALRAALFNLILGRDEAPRALLHLDLRPPNLAVRDGRIVSVLDLGNAIIGDPLLELARIRGCGLLSPAFLQGYQLAPATLCKQAAILDAYELDLALLLVVVSREEFTDDELHAAMSQRAAMLLKHVIAGSPS